MKNFKSFSSKKKVKLPLGLKEMIEPWDSVATVIVVNHQVSHLHTTFAMAVLRFFNCIKHFIWIKNSTNSVTFEKFIITSCSNCPSSTSFLHESTCRDEWIHPRITFQNKLLAPLKVSKQNQKDSFGQIYQTMQNIFDYHFFACEPVKSS